MDTGVGMNRKLQSVALVLLCVASLFMLDACKSSTVIPVGNPAYNGTFTGPVTVNTPTGPVADTITMNLTVMSPMTGTILFNTLGFTGTISGDASDDMATFTITITGPCPGTLTGNMVIVVSVSGATISVDATGSDCNGTLGFTGMAGSIEICDDSMDNDGDSLVDCNDPDCAMDPVCAPAAVCGDNMVDGMEQCDDGNTMACDGCSDMCMTEAGLVCGDNTLNTVCGEQCDDGNTMACDGCSDMCVTETGLVCGDGTLNTTCGEQCDDGNTMSCDGCSNMCVTETGLVCGDGVLNTTCGEQCDDGNTMSGDGCDSSCMTEGGCAGAAASDPNIADCPAAAPTGGCAFDVAGAYSMSDFTCNDVCTTLGFACVDAFDGDFTFCQPLSSAQACTVPFSMIGGQPDMHCHCI